MSVELGYLFLFSVLYLALLFFVAYATEQGWIPQRIVRHPATYTLSLGVYLTSWSYYGSVGLAEQQGFLFLAIYFGPTLAFLLAPVLLTPLLRVTQTHQLASIADLFALRYNSQVAGIVVTLFTLAGTLPYIALQIRAVSESLQVLTRQSTPAEVGFVFCVTLTVFAILFGARHVSPRDKHEGIVVAIAFETVVKMAALCIVGTFAVFGVFGGPAGMEGWLETHPQAIEALYQPVREAPWTTLILLSFAAAFLLPRQFHMGFVENLEPRSLQVASWAFPLLLLIFNLPVPVVLWAGQAIGVDTTPDYYVLGITLHASNPALAVVAFIGGLSAASAMVIVTTLALAAMALHHLLLPASYPDPSVDMYRWLIWGRRMLIGLILLTGYFLYLVIEHNEGLAQLGLISFVAVAQFLPGIVGALFWPRATKYGFLGGLLAGGAVWYATLLLPLVEQSGMVSTQFDLQQFMGAEAQDRWEFATFWSLSLNALLFVILSLLTRQDAEERRAVAACFQDNLEMLERPVIGSSSAQGFRERLSAVIGEAAGENEVDKALAELRLSPVTSNPRELQRLRDRVEHNLSGMLGPIMARVILDARLQMDEGARTMLADHMRYVEERLEHSRNRLRGLALELDGWRRYHQRVLQDLPLGACSLSASGEILSWNQAMVELSGIERQLAVGERLADLRQPWGALIGQLISGDQEHVHKRKVLIDGRLRCFSLHKAATAPTPGANQDNSDESWTGLVVLIEDLTEVQNLEDELVHSERLASIGRLAAGVAHEIGNPLTGIACLTQNLRDETEASVVRESIDEILQQTQRITDIVKSLMTFSHGGAPDGQRMSQLDLWHCVEDAWRLVCLSRDAREVEFLNRCEPQLLIEADRQRLLQVFVNLLTNASDACKPGDRVIVSASPEGSSELVIRVADSGQGIPEVLRERILEPFFTTKEPGAGTGLGLPLAYGIVRDHGGSMSIDSSRDGGTCVTIRVPCTQPSLTAPSETAARPTVDTADGGA